MRIVYRHKINFCNINNIRIILEEREEARAAGWHIEFRKERKPRFLAGFERDIDINDRLAIAKSSTETGSLFYIISMNCLYTYIFFFFFLQLKSLCVHISFCLQRSSPDSDIHEKGETT